MPEAGFACGLRSAVVGATIVLQGLHYNWHPLAAPTAEELADLGAALREGGSWRAVRDYLEARLTAKIETLFRSLGGIVKDIGVPVVFVLPEFNLPDWRSDR